MSWRRKTALFALHNILIGAAMVVVRIAVYIPETFWSYVKEAVGLTVLGVPMVVAGCLCARATPAIAISLGRLARRHGLGFSDQTDEMRPLPPAGFAFVAALWILALVLSLNGFVRTVIVPFEPPVLSDIMAGIMLTSGAAVTAIPAALLMTATLWTCAFLRYCRRRIRGVAASSA